MILIFIKSSHMPNYQLFICSQLPAQPFSYLGLESILFCPNRIMKYLSPFLKYLITKQIIPCDLGTCHHICAISFKRMPADRRNQLFHRRRHSHTMTMRNSYRYFVFFPIPQCRQTHNRLVSMDDVISSLFHNFPDLCQKTDGIFFIAGNKKNSPTHFFNFSIAIIFSFVPAHKIHAEFFHVHGSQVIHQKASHSTVRIHIGNIQNSDSLISHYLPAFNLVNSFVFFVFTKVITFASR